MWVARDGPGIILELRRDAGQHALLDSAWRHIKPGSRIDTDMWSGYNLLEATYEHHSVKHSEQYVTAEGAHCNAAEAEWSTFKPWWRQFRGVAKRYVYQYLIQYEFRRTHRDHSACVQFSTEERASQPRGKSPGLAQGEATNAS